VRASGVRRTRALRVGGTDDKILELQQFAVRQQAEYNIPAMTSVSDELAMLLASDIGRLRHEIASFHTPDLLWRVLPGIANAAGNLALHVEGNLREYVGRQLGGIPYRRDRTFEFAGRNVRTEEILSRLTELEGIIPEVVESLTEQRLDETYPEVVLDLPMTVRQFIIHLHGHLTYHTGQINYIRRLLHGRGEPLA
jgi:Protein of unknown function (DUF1572)